MRCKKQGVKNRVIVIQKEKMQLVVLAAWPLFVLNNNDPVLGTMLFAPHILDLIFFRVANKKQK